jgi:SNF2 family DNA or RNA helicase
MSMMNAEPPTASLPAEKEVLEEYFRNKFTFFDNPEGFDGMPTSTVSTHILEMPLAYYREYLNIQQHMHPDWGNPFVFLTGLRRATNKLRPNPKIDWIIDRIVTQNLKTVIYSSFKGSGIRIIQESLTDRKIAWEEISGDQSVSERKAAVERYNSNKVKILFITKAGGLGLDLKETRDIILLEPVWNHAGEQQIIGRAIRIGSHTNLPPDERRVEIHHMILAKPAERFPGDTDFGSADQILSNIVQEKKKSQELMDLIRSVAF